MFILVTYPPPIEAGESLLNHIESLLPASWLGLLKSIRDFSFLQKC